MEIKFFDRLKAIDKIREMVNEKSDNSPTSFYEALEKALRQLKSTIWGRRMNKFIPFSQKQLSVLNWWCKGSDVKE